MISHYNERVKLYTEAHSNDIVELLDEIQRYSHLYSHSPQMVSDKIQGNLLSLLSKLMSPQLIVEVGTFTGYATICLASGLAHNGKMISIDHQSTYSEYVLKNLKTIGLYKKISLIKASALDYLPLIESPIDLAFIDAAKREYSQYFDILIDKMKSGGLIIADNTLWKGQVALEKCDKIATSLKLFNKKVVEDPRVEVTFLPHRDGLSLIYIK